MVGRVWRWLGRRPWLLLLVFILVVVAGGFWRVGQLYQRDHQTRVCVAAAVDQLVARADALREPNEELRTATDELIRSAGSGDPVLFNDKLNNYVEKSDKLKQAQRDNPVPERPRFTCPE